MNRATSASSKPQPSETLIDRIKRARKSSNVRFVAARDAELVAYHSWVLHAAQAARQSVPADTPSPQGFHALFNQNPPAWLLLERPEHRRGAALVVLGVQPQHKIVVEAPHSYFDTGTLQLAVDAFERLRATALLVNTFHRGGHGSPEEREERALGGDSESDVAHAEKSFFTTAHRTLTELDPALTAIQLHGYSNASVRGVDLIVSAAETRAAVEPLARALRKALPKVNVATYPDQVSLLGGTTNVQAKLSRELHARLFHLELSHRLRRRLRDDEKLRIDFIGALERGVAAE